MVTLKFPGPLPAAGDTFRVPPPNGGVCGSPATVHVTPLPAATWNVVESVPPAQVPAVPSVTFRGVTALTTGAATVSVVLPEILPDFAVMTDVPGFTPAARPVPEIVATDVVPDDHVTDPVMSGVVPSEYVPVALNCFDWDVAMLGLTGVTAID